jgi:hypothetical protein
MGKLGVREKSLIHQTPLRKSVPFPTPGFGTGFVPFGAVEAEDGEQGVPGGTLNFGGSQINPSAGSLWQYKAKTTATSGYPGDGYMLWDNATQISAANLILSHLTTDDLDIDVILSQLASGQTIIVQDWNDSANYQKWKINGAPTNTNGGTATSYWTVPVTFLSSAGTGTTGFANNHQLFVAVPGGGGGGSTTTNVTNNYIVAQQEPDDAELASPSPGNFGGIQNSGLANMAAHTVKANITGSAEAPVDSSLTAIFDAELGNTNGFVATRVAGTWTAAAASGGGSLTTQQDGTNKSTTVTTLNIQGPAVISGAGATATLNIVNPAVVSLGCGMV